MNTPEEKRGKAPNENTNRPDDRATSPAKSSLATEFDELLDETLKALPAGTYLRISVARQSGGFGKPETNWFASIGTPDAQSHLFTSQKEAIDYVRNFKPEDARAKRIAQLRSELSKLETLSGGQTP